MREEILKKIREIISGISELDVNEVKLDSSLMDLSLSSIEIMSFVAEVQRAYNIQISTDELISIETVGGLVELIEKKTM